MTATEPKRKRSLVLVGGGEHACVVADAALASESWVLRGYTGPSRGEMVEARFGLSYLGDDARGAADHSDADFVLALGTRETRVRVSGHLEAAGVRFATVVHPRATVSPTARLAAGVVIMAGAVVNTGAVIGSHCIVNTGAVIEHDVELERLVHVAPGATIGGGAKIGAEVVVGLGASVRDHITVGRGAVIGMGAVVVNDVRAGDTVIGVPARRRGHGREANS
jgi:acetyltransferase EpsM